MIIDTIQEWFKEVLIDGIISNLSGTFDTVAIWECMGYTVLLCYTLFKTGSLAKSLFGAH